MSAFVLWPKNTYCSSQWWWWLLICMDWNGGKGSTKYSEKNLPLCHFIHFKF